MAISCRIIANYAGSAFAVRQGRGRKLLAAHLPLLTNRTFVIFHCRPGPEKTKLWLKILKWYLSRKKISISAR
tara:strand:+ start:451 stop:669 length:219 start_codon:yes stop_codon:yes gene_type:complete